jgi:hypothetical protein
MIAAAPRPAVHGCPPLEGRVQFLTPHLSSMLLPIRIRRLLSWVRPLMQQEWVQVVAMVMTLLMFLLVRGVANWLWLRGKVPAVVGVEIVVRVMLLHLIPSATQWSFLVDVVAAVVAAVVVIVVPRPVLTTSRSESRSGNRSRNRVENLTFPFPFPAAAATDNGTTILAAAAAALGATMFGSRGGSLGWSGWRRPCCGHTSIRRPVTSGGRQRHEGRSRSRRPRHGRDGPEAGDGWWWWWWCFCCCCSWFFPLLLLLLLLLLLVLVLLLLLVQRRLASDRPVGLHHRRIDNVLGGRVVLVHGCLHVTLTDAVLMLARHGKEGRREGRRTEGWVPVRPLSLCCPRRAYQSR